ncbi:MAG TPA: hypothetical protein VLF95_03715 [Vicinamibacteria bacterium]|nr:hypothetical protein [Vicinamibacteria bacterium]
MRTRLSLLAVLALAWPPASTAAGASAIVVVAEDGGFPAATVQTVRSLTTTELRARGVEVGDDPAGASRRFVLSLGRLEQKVLITLEDVALPATVPEFAATHAAASLDEADTVIPRLVRAVLDREPFEKGARMGTVTAQESAPFRRRPGEGLFVVGIGLDPLGGSIGWSYEARRFRLGVLAQGAGEGGSFFGIDGAWVPHDGNVSPYLGVGLGAVSGGDDAALGTKLEAGVEFFRLHGVRLMAGVGAIVPFESRPGDDRVSWSLALRCGF